MKRVHLIGILGSASIFLFAVVYSVFPKKEKLPAFELQLADSLQTVFNTKDLPNGTPIIMMFFSPDCENCQDETKDIVARMNDLKNVTFCYVSNDTLKNVRAFRDYFGLGHFSNVYIGRDPKYAFIIHFRPKATPTIVLFNKRKELYAYITGKTSVDSLLYYVKSM